MTSPRPAAGRLYTNLVSGVLFPVHEWLKGHRSLAVRKALEESQWWPRERLAALQLARLTSLLRRANEEVPYYRTVFRRIGLDPRDIKALDDLKRVPLLTKADVRADPEALKSGRGDSLARFNTGGSTGEPLIFYIGKQRVTHDIAAKWRATRWWRVDIGDPEVVVWGSPIELGTQDWLRRLRDGILRSYLLPAFEMSDAKLDQFVRAIRAIRPRMLFGYPSALAHIARHAAARSIAMNDLGIAVAFVTAERLYDDQRVAIESVYGCPVANGYGGRDSGFIAHACPAGGMHITAEDIIVETVGVDGCPVGQGSPGEIVITHLATSDYPFVRYRTGDVGVLETRPCDCGRGLPILKEIQGRTTDFVVAQDNTVIHGLALIYAVRDLPGVERFKIVQHDLDHTEVQLVCSSTYRYELDEGIRTEFRQRLGRAVRISINHVASIEPEASGKHRYVVSKVATSSDPPRIPDREPA